MSATDPLTENLWYPRSLQTRRERLWCSLTHWRYRLAKHLGGHYGFAESVGYRCTKCRTEWTAFVP